MGMCLPQVSLFLAMWMLQLDLLCFTCVLSIRPSLCIQIRCSQNEDRVLSSVCWLAGWLAGLHKNYGIEFGETCWGNGLKFGAHLDKGVDEGILIQGVCGALA